MAVLAPLAIPAAEALWSAIVFVGSALAASAGIVALSEKIEEKFSNDKPSAIQSCPMAKAGNDEAAPPAEDVPEEKASPPRARVPPDRRKHILDGDQTGGGHRHGTGKPGKSEFPADWSDDKIISEIEDVANDPSIPAEQQGDRSVKVGTRDGIKIRTVADSDGEIVTGYPINVPKNP
jgi:hypothetical protein